MLTIEDVTEEIVGEIEDEHDFDDIIDEKISNVEFCDFCQNGGRSNK